MTDIAPVEHDDHWDMPLAGARIERVSFDWAVVLLFGDSFELRISEQFRLTRADGTTTLIDPEGEPEGASPALTVSRRTVEWARAHKDGRFSLRLSGPTSIEVPSGEDHEPWGIVGPRGFRFVSLPGGGLAIWDPDPPNNPTPGR